MLVGHVGSLWDPCVWSRGVLVVGCCLLDEPVDLEEEAEHEEDHQTEAAHEADSIVRQVLKRSNDRGEHEEPRTRDENCDRTSVSVIGATGCQLGRRVAYAWALVRVHRTT